MDLNNIIFADLSTYTPKETIHFYESVFGWKYYQDGDYYLAYKGSQEVVGLYETPDRFQQMNMPHFWMTYMKVTAIESKVEKAKKLGGIIEMESQINGLGKVALIRDPQGAGFTIYEGGTLTSTRTKNEANTLIWNELHVSNTSKVLPFYEELLDWKFEKSDFDSYQVFNLEENHVADIKQIPNAYKGKYEYWVCTFGVKDLQESKERILKNHGSILFEEDNRALMSDNSDQSFFYIQEV